jgi:hypothetical protein
VTYNAREAELWSAKGFSNFVDLAAAAPSPPPAPKEEDDWESPMTAASAQKASTATHSTTASLFVVFTVFYTNSVEIE